MTEETTERRIVAAAIRTHGITCSMPAPARHHHVIHAMYYAGWGDESRSEHEQGFLDSAGVFLTREEAYVVAEAAGQIIARGPHRVGMLFSEDVW